jgi:hypothetical protein
MFTGEHLRLVRQIKGNQTQKIVSRKLRIKQSSYCKWEKSKLVNEEKLQRFLKAVECSQEDFEKIVELLFLQNRIE